MSDDVAHRLDGLTVYYLLIVALIGTLFTSGVVFALLLCLALFWLVSIPSLIVEGRPAVKLPNDIAALMEPESGEQARFVRLGNTDFSERSGLFSRLIGIPHGVNVGDEGSDRFVLEKLVHETGHVIYRDSRTVLMLFALLIVAISQSIVPLFSDFSAAPTSLERGLYAQMLEDGVSSPAVESYQEEQQLFGLFISSTFAGIAVIAILRLLLLLRHREFRADDYAFRKLGPQYADFLRHQALKERFTQTSPLTSLLGQLTHPSFSSRVKRLGRYGSSRGGAFFDGLFWATLLFLGLPFCLFFIAFGFAELQGSAYGISELIDSGRLQSIVHSSTFGRTVFVGAFILAGTLGFHLAFLGAYRTTDSFLRRRHGIIQFTLFAVGHAILAAGLLTLLSSTQSGFLRASTVFFSVAGFLVSVQIGLLLVALATKAMKLDRTNLLAHTTPWAIVVSTFYVFAYDVVFAVDAFWSLDIPKLNNVLLGAVLMITSLLVVSLILDKARKRIRLAQ